MADTSADYADAQLPARLVAAAQALYLTHGLAAVSLADVARYARLPVRTAEETFPTGQATLVQAVLEAYHYRMGQALRQHSTSYSSAVEELLAFRLFMAQQIREVGDTFFHDLQTHYPAGWQYWLAQRAAGLLTYFRGNLARGIAQQLYRPDLEVETWAQRWLTQVNNLSTTPLANEELAVVHSAQLTQLLADITTPAGAFVFRRLQEPPPTTNLLQPHRQNKLRCGACQWAPGQLRAG